MTTKTAGRPTKHQELTRTLRDLARELRPGDAFPSQSELMRRFQVSDRTVLRSLDDLKQEGWIVRRHGVGTFVADPAQRRGEPFSLSAPPRTRTIGALVTALGPVYQHFIDLLTVQTEAAGYALVCHHARHESSFEDILPLEALQPQGFILFSYYMLPIAQRLIERGHRVVVIGAPPAGVLPEVPSVYNDQDFGGEQATRHLIELGHQRLAYIIPETRYTLDRTLRWQGHRRALAEAAQNGLPITATTIELDTWLLWRDDPAACAAFFARPDAPTGLLAWNDDKGVEMLHILYRAGIRVPDDVSLVGYDGLPIGERSIPPLTTLDSQIGTQIRSLMQFMTQPYPSPPTQSVVVTPSLVRRGSTAAPPPDR